MATPEAVDRVLLFNKVVKSNRRPNINTTWRIQESHYDPTAEYWTGYLDNVGTRIPEAADLVLPFNKTIKSNRRPPKGMVRRNHGECCG